MTEREWEQLRIDRVIMAYGWYFRKYMIAKAGGDQNEIAYWQTRTLDFQRGVQRADPFGRWPMRFAKADRELEEEIIGGKHGRTVRVSEGEAERDVRRRRRRDRY